MLQQREKLAKQCITIVDKTIILLQHHSLSFWQRTVPPLQAGMETHLPVECHVLAHFQPPKMYSWSSHQQKQKARDGYKEEWMDAKLTRILNLVSVWVDTSIFKARSAVIIITYGVPSDQINYTFARSQTSSFANEQTATEFSLIRTQHASLKWQPWENVAPCFPYTAFTFKKYITAEVSSYLYTDLLMI